MYQADRKEERRQRKEDTHDLWIVPYADFMSMLMIFFLIMFVFAYSSKEDKRYAEIVTSIQKEMGGTVKKDVLADMEEKEKAAAVVAKMDAAVARQNLGNFVTINTNTEEIRVTLSSPVLFDSGKADLKEASRKILHEVAEILKGTDNEIIVEGHTDSIPIHSPSFGSNWELSQSRALAVVDHFVRQEQLPAERFAAAGYGEYRPVAVNDTEEHRSLNRRIEITILRKSLS